MKKALKLTLAVALLMGSTSLFAQKFGRINTQEIIMSMPETKTMQTNMEAYAKELQDNIETMNVEFNTKLQDFQKNFNTLNDMAKEMKEKDLNDLQNRIREFQERAQQEYQKKQNELLAPIIEKAKNAIDKISAAGGYLVIFDTSTGSLAYFDEANLTDIAPEAKREPGTPEPPPAPAAEYPDRRPTRTIPATPDPFEGIRRLLCRTGQGWAGEERSGAERSGEDKAEQDRTRQGWQGWQAGRAAVPQNGARSVHYVA